MDRQTSYKYRPVLFFVLAYFFTWVFWIPAIFVTGEIGTGLMLLGLIAPAVVSTLFVVRRVAYVSKDDLYY